MSRWYSLQLALLLVLCGLAAQARDLERELKGEYAFAGEATCLISPGGFDADLTPANFPAPFPQILSFSIQGVRTFNGDGTGTTVARAVSIAHPFALPANGTNPAVFNRGGANSADLQADFTYTVSRDRKLTITTPVVHSNILTGTRAGQTQTITNVPLFTGYLSEDGASLTLSHDEPGIEDHLFSNGDFNQRICHRSRILHERKEPRRHHHHGRD
jgi:hypothetical protein